MTRACFPGLLVVVACHAPIEPVAIDIDTTALGETLSSNLSSTSLLGGTKYNQLTYSSQLTTYSTVDVTSFDKLGTRSGVGANGPSTDGIDGELSGEVLDRSLLDGAGVPFEATLVDGRRYKMVVAGVYRDKHSGRRYYAVETSLEGGVWTPLCGLDGAGEPILALAVPGVFTDLAVSPRDRAGGWRPSSDEFNFACRGASVAKCVEMGFAPHLEPPGQMKEKVKDKAERLQVTRETQRYHQSCVRMLRADYCGDGVSHTREGVRIRYWDQRGRAPDLEGWSFEAGWSEDGATCIEGTRNDMSEVPSCVAERTQARCRGSVMGRALVGNAY